MGFIEKVEALLDYKFGEFPGPDDLPSDFTFDLKHGDEIPTYSKELRNPACGLFTSVSVRKSMSLTLITFNLPSFSNDYMIFLEAFVGNLVEIYAADEKLMLYLLDEEKENILKGGEWAGRYWEFDERYNEMNVFLSLDEKGLNLNFYKFWRPWLDFDDDDEDDDDF